jgi:hypothetical protein
VALALMILTLTLMILALALALALTLTLAFAPLLIVLLHYGVARLVTVFLLFELILPIHLLGVPIP